MSLHDRPPVLKLAFSFLSIALGIAPAETGATLFPLALEEQVNTTTTGAQALPDVACAASGHCVVAWKTAGAVVDESSISAQLYDADGAPIGGELSVSSVVIAPPSSIGPPAVCMGPTGNAVIAWTLPDPIDPPASDVYARVYDAAANALTSEFVVNAYTTGYQFTSGVGCAGDGTFVVTWSGVTPPPGVDGDPDGVFARRFDSVGASLGTDFRVNFDAAGDQLGGRVTSHDDGGFTVVWLEDFITFPSYHAQKVSGRSFDATGTPLDDGFNVRSVSFTPPFNDAVYNPRIAGNGSDFVVSWDELNDYQFATLARRFTGGSGSSVFGLTDESTLVDVGMRDDGDFLVTWSSDSAPGDFFDSGISARLHAGDLGPPTPDLRVNHAIAGNQTNPSVAATSDGGFLIAWMSEPHDGDATAVIARRFAEMSVCYEPTASKALLLRRDGARDRLKWKWGKPAFVETFAPEAFGEPTVTTSYTLSIYDATGLVYEFTIPSSASWKATPGGFDYGDKTGAEDGITAIALRHGGSSAAKARIAIKGTGSSLALGSVALAAPVTFVLRNSEDECWAMQYGSPNSSTADRFAARR